MKLSEYEGIEAPGFFEINRQILWEAKRHDFKTLIFLNIFLNMFEIVGKIKLENKYKGLTQAGRLETVTIIININFQLVITLCWRQENNMIP